MLKTVAQTFLKTFHILTLFIISFTFGFHVIFYEKNLLIHGLNNTGYNRDDNNDFGFYDFDNWWMSILKVTVMLGGEFEATSMDYKKFWFTSVFVFAFVLSAFMMYNFINGLAINDIQVYQ